jgi:GNAT superfamily N-acetyltransferase
MPEITKCHASLSAQGLTFRSVTVNDMTLLNRLMREGKGYWGYPEEGLDRFMKIFGILDTSYFDKGFGFIAELGGDVVGQYLFKTNENPPQLDHFFLNTLFIGQGYGRQLWSHCISQAQKRGWTEFTFWSDPHSLAFYEHMGAIKIDERPMVTLPGHMAPIMKYSIGSS